MSKRVYRTANGKTINIDSIIAQNEESIAVGNMRVNARGDELGPGGRVERPKEKVMADYYKLNTPIASDHIPTPREATKKDLVDDWVEPAVALQPVDNTNEPEDLQPTARPVRGSLASAVAKTQPAKDPEIKKSGPSRI